MHHTKDTTTYRYTTCSDYQYRFNYGTACGSYEQICETCIHYHIKNCNCTLKTTISGSYTTSKSKDDKNRKLDDLKDFLKKKDRRLR